MQANTFAKIWEETVVIPTYPAGQPEKSPLFIEKRAYQGSTGKVYPLPVTETISNEKTDVEYRAVFLENEYLKIMILPELGGRIQRAYDKTNGYDFVYYNHVIRPALVGLAGPWISGGIEFNWPQHHRPSTFSPVDYTLEENKDGSCTVYLSETDKMYGTKGMAAISLYPGKAYIEVRGQLYNGTDLPQTFLWWANPAVPVNDDTYSVFPPDVNAVMDHGKRAVSTFPIATGEYYKWDYSAGVDISRYKNVKVPTSYMAAHSDFDFIGNYDEGREAGLLHVADHHISPGKKQWTWGNGDFGRMWDRNLTESDGPYIELMTGAFTDNQPDFSWLKPQEEKNFVQYFMPYKGVGRVGNATKDAVISLTWEMEGDGAVSFHEAHVADGVFSADGSACAEENGLANGNISARKLIWKVYATGEFPGAEVVLFINGKEVCRQQASLSPTTCVTGSFELEVSAAKEEKVSYLVEVEANYRVEVQWKGRTLVNCSPYKKELSPIPQPVEPLKKPEELKSLEELYLAATHLEQYRHATREPAEYYLEGLRRDPTDIRLNNGYGLLLLRRGRIQESIPYFQAAIRKQTWRNPNPYSGECYFNLGLAYALNGQEETAYDAFFKSTWSADTQSAGFYWLSCLVARAGRIFSTSPEQPAKGETAAYEQALEFAEQSMIRNWHNMNARMLKAAMLRRLGRPSEAFLRECLEIDPLHMGCLYEMALLPFYDKQQNAPYTEKNAVYQDDAIDRMLDEPGKKIHLTREKWKKRMRQEAHNYLALSLDYSKAGLYEEALDILQAAPEQSPLCFYYQGFLYGKMGAEARAKQCCQRAEEAPPDYCFPNRIEEIEILEYAVRILETAPMAHYYLGNLFYDKKQYADAIRHWEAAVETTLLMEARCAKGEAVETARAADAAPARTPPPMEIASRWAAAVERGGSLAMAHRNLSIAYYNKGVKESVRYFALSGKTSKDVLSSGDRLAQMKNVSMEAALQEMKRACELDGEYPRMWLEYDQLASRLNLSVRERLETMEKHSDLLEKRDDLYLRWITLLNCAGLHQEALDALLAHPFHPWEGGEGKVSGQYRYALSRLAIGCLNRGEAENALAYLEASLTYPVVLGEGKLPNVPDNQAYYYMGLAYRIMGDAQKEHEYLELAASGPQEPEPVLYYNDQPSDFIFYQGLANRALGREAAAKKAFHRLIAYGEAHVFDDVEYDFFAVSLPEIEVFQEDIQKRNWLYCNYLRALGSIGLGEKKKAAALFEEILSEQADYQGALAHLEMAK